MTLPSELTSGAVTASSIRIPRKRRHATTANDAFKLIPVRFSSESLALLTTKFLLNSGILIQGLAGDHLIPISETSIPSSVLPLTRSGAANRSLVC